MERQLLYQPQTLEDLAIDKAAVWIGTHIDNIKPTIVNLHNVDEAKAETLLSEKIEIIRNRLERNVPRLLYDKLLTKTILELCRLLSETVAHRGIIYNNLGIANITNERMVETLFTNKVTSLSLTFEQFNMLRRPLSSKSHLLTDLTSLEMKSYKTKFVFDYTTHFQNEIIQMVQALHNLKCLNILTLYTDRMVRCIVKNCPLIEELTLPATNQLSDDTLKLLPQLIHLRSITLGSKLKISAYVKILLNCKKIEYINCLKLSEHMKVSEAVKRVAFSKNAETLNLKYYRVFNPSKQNMEKIFRICPLIQNLVIYQTSTSKNNSADDLSPIYELKYLREMTLYATYNIYTPFKLMLRVVGPKLEHLCYAGGNELDLDAVIELSKMCPNLRSLHIIQHKFIDMPISRNERKFEVSPFKRLRKLIVTVDIPTVDGRVVKYDNAPVTFLLSNCPNVEFLEVYIPSWFTEEELLKIIDLNPLRNLQKIKILYSRGKLTPLFLKLLTKNCNDPEVIELGAFF